MIKFSFNELPLVGKIGSVAGTVYVIFATLYTTLRAYFWIKDKFGKPIKISVTHGWPTWPKKPNISFDDAYSLFLEVSHTGGEPIALQTAGFELPDGREMPIIKSDLPITLKTGSPKHMEILPVKVMGKSLKENEGDIPVKGWVKDSQGEKHYVKINQGIRKNLRDFLKEQGIFSSR